MKTISSLPQELHGIILTYLCPTEDPDVVLVLNTKFKNSLDEWTKSLEITTDQYVYQITRVNNKIHKSGDNPAIIYIDGSKAWYINDKLCRKNGKPFYETPKVNIKRISESEW